MFQKGKLSEEDIGTVPDIYTLNQKIDDKMKQMKEDLDKWKSASKFVFFGFGTYVFSKLQETLEKLKKERDFHRMHHKRVGQEKNKLLNDIKKIKEKYESYKPLAEDWQTKYENIRREKVVLQLEKDKLQKRANEIESEGSRTESPNKPAKAVEASPSKPPQSAKSVKLASTVPPTATKRVGIPDNRVNPFADKTIPPSQKLANGSPFVKQSRSFKAHDATIIS
jgi:regulator of replication initiation timing